MQVTQRKELKVGAHVPCWKTATEPVAAPMIGEYCDLVPLDIERHAAQLFLVFSEDAQGSNWTYLPAHPPKNLTEFEQYLALTCSGSDPLFFVVEDKQERLALGMAALMRIDIASGVIEVGHIHFSQRLQKTVLATEAMFLLMQQVFNWGYRRYEWKCDSLNAPSQKAAQRFGFTLEGVFRQALIYKGRNRDTAWFSILDGEWPAQQAAFKRWLRAENFDATGAQKQRLQRYLIKEREMIYSVNGLNESDREQWQSLYCAYAEFYKVPMDERILNQVWQWIFDPSERFYALIAKDEQGVAVGLMHYRGMHSPLRGAIVGFLDDLYVDPKCRGDGVVDRLFVALEKQATIHSWPFVRWITAENNYRGRAVYDRVASKTPWLTYQLATEVAV